MSEPAVEFYRAVLDDSPLLVACQGAEGCWHSPAVGRIFGIPDGAAVSEWLARLVHPDDQPVATALLRGATRDEPTELRVRDRDEAFRVLAITRRDLAGTGTVYYATDVTRNRVSLTALSGLKSEFIAVVSHELRTPLTTIASLVELVGSRGLPASDAGAAMATVRRNTERMLALVDDLNLLADLECGGLRGHVTLVDVADLVREAVSRVAAPGTRLAASVSEGPPVSGDRVLLEQLMQSVLDASVMLAGTGPVNVDASVDGTGWRIAACATGDAVGTPEKLLTTGRPEPDAAPYRRSVAMSVLLARAIATSHHGAFSLAHEPDGRTSITVQLPAL